jgi:outer membrane protein TolC
VNHVISLFSKENISSRPIRFSLWIALLAVLGACSSAPVELTDSELEQRTTQTLDSLFAEYPEVQKEVTLGEAMARSLLFNLDDRVQLLKIAVEQKAKNVERLDLLPKLTLDAGYSSFSENLASYNKNTVTEIRSTQPTLSSEDETAQANLNLAWNILDFGVSYVRSQQQADRILIAEARRQQTMQNVLTDVRAAFWRAYAAQQWETPVESLLADLEVGLENSRRAGESGAVTKEEALRVQSGLLETMGDLLTIKKRLAGAKNELAGLMNLRPGEPYQLTLDKNVKKQLEKERQSSFAGLKLSDRQVENLEEKALTTRPELLIADYNVRIMQRDIKRLMLSMLPGVDFSLGGYYDGNDFKRYDQYTRLGLNVGYDLFNLMKWPAHKQQAKNKVLLEEEKRKALAMAVLTQLHVALAQHGLTQRQLNYADRLARVDEKILNENTNQLRVGAARPNEVLQSRLNFVESGLTRDWLFAERQRTVDQLYIASGISLAEPLPKEVIQKEDLAAKLNDVTRSMSARTNRLHDLGAVLAQHAAGRDTKELTVAPKKPAIKPRKKADVVVANKKPKQKAVKKSKEKMPTSSVKKQNVTPKASSKTGRTSSVVKPSKPPVVTTAKTPKSAVKSTQYAEARSWCVYVGYFKSAASADRYINSLVSKSSRPLVVEPTGKGYVTRSQVLSYNDAYTFRDEARSSFAKDAYIRKCQ